MSAKIEKEVQGERFITLPLKAMNNFQMHQIAKVYNEGTISTPSHLSIV